MNGELKKIAKNIGWMTFDKVFYLILNLLVTVRVANYYGSADYGLYQYALNVVAIFEILVTLTDGRVVKKRYSQYLPEEVVISATFSRFLFSGISCMAGGIYLIFARQGREYKEIFLVLLMNAVILNCKFGMENRFEYLLQSKKVVIASDISAAVGCLFQLGAVAVHLPFIAIAFISTITAIIQFFIIFVQYRSAFHSGIIGRVDKGLLKEIIAESFPLAVAASCATIYQRCDTVMLGSMLSVADVGVYAIAVKLIGIVQIAIMPVQNSVYPKLITLFKINKEEYEKLYIRISSMLTWLYIAGVMVSFFVLPVAFKYLKPEYGAAFGVYKIYVLGSFFMYNAVLRAGHFTLINRGNILMFSQIISVILNIILNYFGIKIMGMYGAAMATVITQGVSLLLCNLLFGKDGREVFLWQIKAINPRYIFIRR